MLKYFTKLENRSKSFIILFGLAQIIILGFITYILGYEISFSVFYLIPVAMAAWFTERNVALAISLFSAIMWIAANYYAGEHFSHPLIPIWNATTRLGFFLVVAVLITKLKQSYLHESSLARTDFLTGAANPRAFYELAQLEIDRSRRFNRIFSIMYLDVDNFKQINDTLGHNDGNDLLVRIVYTVKQNLRSTDVVARLGGDEFAVLLTETDQQQVRVVTDKIREMLLAEMKKEKWAVTFSIGVLTCLKPPKTAEEVVKVVDELMYEVKNSGKNSVKFQEFSDDSPTVDYRKNTNFADTESV